MKLKKILTLACCAALLVCISVGATLAYLTSTTETVKNTFTVGGVAITLDEAKVDVYGVVDEEATNRVTANTYKLVPGHTYTKDPTIHIADGSEKAWIFVKVENGISAIEADTTIAAQMKENGWTAVAGATNVYAYKNAVTADDVEEGKDGFVVFETFTVDGDADVASYAGKTIEITGYAVQADGFDTAAKAWEATFGAPTEEETAGE